MKKLLVGRLRITMGWFVRSLRTRWGYRIFCMILFGSIGGGLFVYVAYHDWHFRAPWGFFVFLVFISALGGLGYSWVMEKFYWGPMEGTDSGRHDSGRRE